ncbi:MAG TPA: hypothetical protein PKL17_18765 [Pseudomonadota bacterium]|nr:hypothetical protein [Pseudomonadota bacterium]
MLPNFRALGSSRESGSLRFFRPGMWWLLAALIGFSSLPAHAAPLILVLGIKREGQSSAKSRSVVAQHLLRMGEPAVSPSLQSSELLCTEKPCLTRLGKAFSARRLIGGEVFPNDRSYLVRLWLYDLDAEQPTLVEERCTDCSEELLQESVSRAAGRLVDALAAQAALVPVAPAPSAPSPQLVPVPVAPPPVGSSGGSFATTPGQPARTESPAATNASEPQSTEPGLDLEPAKLRCLPRIYTFKRGLFAGALSAVGLVGLASAIALSAKDGDVYLPADGDLYPTDMLNNFGRTARSLYGVAALGIVGGAAALAPWERWTTSGVPACPETAQDRWTFRRGLAVGAFGSLTVAGLVVSGAMAGLDGKTWGFNQIGTPVPYQMHTATQAGFGTTAGMAIGLALSLLIP